MTVVVAGLVEGPTDRVALGRLFRFVGLSEGTIYDKNGKRVLLQQLAAYDKAARHSPWAVLVDLDNDADCAPPFVRAHLPVPARQMAFSVAVRALEAWLLADAASMAAFLHVREAQVPGDPEALADPNRAVVDLARHSRREAIRRDMTPRRGAGRPVGPAYTSRLIEFVECSWNIEAAAERSPSLARCVARLRAIGGDPP